MLEIGSVIDGKYKILDEIGHGGMSTVYLAINEKANKPWAIKEVRKSFHKDFGILKQSLITEMDLLKKLRHASLPSIVDVIDSDENFLIVMDYIEGNTLERIIKQEGVQSQEKVVDWALQLCDVLDYLHTRSTPVIYRDMKPANIMLKSDGRVVLIDFGTAREFKERNLSDTVLLGTQGYAAPEQFGGMGQTDARTDIYSLGATLYHLVTGHNPSEPPYEMYPITKWDAKLSTGLEQIIQKCTQKNPNDRYQTIKELKYELENYHDLEIQAQRKYRKHLRVFAAIACITFMCAVGSAGFKSAASSMKEDTYHEILDMAEINTDSIDACKMCIEAITIDDVNAEAYHKFYARAIEDGVFSDDEEDLLLKLSISAHKYLQNFEENNNKGYADFCYEIGNAYWYYYEHEENRQSRAVHWFQSAIKYFEGDEERAAEYRRCVLYVELGSFYKNVIISQIDGTDSGMYGRYWNSLSELKALNDVEPDRERITLRIYREIASRVVEYVKYFKDDGISREEIAAMLDEIENDMEEMKQGATSSTCEEIETIMWIIEGAHNMLRSTYK